ncbi:uncharacterized protein LACBIDRAFT_328608 [Laccaria bicolor S238N-H82]|uniref:Predicted protein n=1 Tax=Laccaria bicolor (strain S238N-H82 / ATCC MYA-4686) TaxID=486041 RepID=B0DFF0_LACBS|nr:uncharacterized protein LACBIDRAFT_328608 [Laccaria bicolor S238N-H82]EDR06692.1 predicted protein [Laccaria bicolor S238N-H82]|eukprot:XP_001882539.1 predicted protein [Laccaria bicolor S238N-H82]
MLDGTVKWTSAREVNWVLAAYNKVAPCDPQEMLDENTITFKLLIVQHIGLPSTWNNLFITLFDDLFITLCLFCGPLINNSIKRSKRGPAGPPLPPKMVSQNLPVCTPWVCKPQCVTEAQNQIDLISELRLLALGQYFAESFTLRLAAHEVDVSTSIHWNFQDAFIGDVSSGMLPCPDIGEEDLRSLSFLTFLAVPLITTTGLYTERKFSGSDAAGNNLDEVGRIVDPYAHHVLVDSQGSYLLTDLQGPDKEVILFDPQAHSRESETGFWDGGHEHIKMWKKEHKCQNFTYVAA